MTTPTPLFLAGVDDLPLRGWRYERGSGAGPTVRHEPSTRGTVLLLHGFGNDSRIWDPIAHSLAAEHTVYALDFRGHGDSAWDSGPRYDHWTLAADVHTVAAQLNLERPLYLIGHSLGARVGLLYLQRYRPTLAGVAILDTGPEIGAAGVSRVRRDAETAPATFGSPAHYLSWLQRSYVLAEPTALAAWARRNLRQSETGDWQPKTDPAFARSLWRADRHRGDASDLAQPLDEALIEALRSVECPALVLRGEMSAILRRRSAERMVADWLGDGHLVTIPGAGHALLVDQPVAVAEALAAFLAATSGQGTVKNRKTAPTRSGAG